MGQRREQHQDEGQQVGGVLGEVWAEGAHKDFADSALPPPRLVGRILIIGTFTVTRAFTPDLEEIAPTETAASRLPVLPV